MHGAATRSVYGVSPLSTEELRLTPREMGLRGAAARWGPRRRLVISDLSPEQRNVVLALVDAQRAANAAMAATRKADDK